MLLRNIVVVYFGTFVRLENESLESIIEFTKRREIQDMLSFDKLVVKGHRRANILNISRSIIIEINIHKVIYN
jgi:hypothetical protein